MKYNVLFSQGEEKVDWFSTNIIEFDFNGVDLSKCFRLTYSLNEERLTKKFIKGFIETQNNNVRDFGVPIYNYNYYYNPVKKFFLKAKQEMNDVIDELNQLNKKLNFFLIDTNLKLDVAGEDACEPEFEKINELHFIFEKQLIELTEEFPEKQRMWYLLEKVNNLVHFIERKMDKTEYGFHYFMISVRTKGGIENFYKLENDDYDSFRFFQPGDLVADYSTVGKDLWAAATTNDFNLVKNKELKQQEYLTGYAFMPFNYGQTDPPLSEYYDWLEKNNVGNYIDLTDKKYTPGRHILGHVDLPFSSKQRFYDHVIRNTPYLIGTYISDDEGNIITTTEGLDL